MGQWSGPIDLPGIVAIHTTLMPNGKVLFFYNNPEFGDEARGRVMVWDPATQTGVRRDVPANIWCAGQVLLADGRVLVVGGNLKYEVGGPAGSFKGLNQIWIFDPTTETWLRGPDMRTAAGTRRPPSCPTAEVLITAGWDESGGGAAPTTRTSRSTRPRPTATAPAPCGSWRTATSTTTRTSTCSPTAASSSPARATSTPPSSTRATGPSRTSRT